MDAPRPKLPPAHQLQLPGRGRTWVYDTGEPSAHDGAGSPSVVLLHGWTSTAALNWYRCFGPLSRHYRVIALDQRGHGRGIRSRRPFQLEACADDVGALVDELGLAPAIIAGYSMGGSVAQLVWKRHRQAVGGLVLCATAARFAVKHELDGPLAVAGLGLSFALTGLPYRVRHEMVSRLLRARATQGTASWAIEEWERNDPAAVIQAGLALGRFDSTSWVGAVDVPTAVVVTTADTTVPPERQRRLAELIPEAVTIEVEGTHRACVDQARLFVPALLQACDLVATTAARSSRQETTPAG